MEPRTELAAAAGLELDPSNGGFLVNGELEARADVYAAGDAASFWDPSLRIRRRAEHLNYAEEIGFRAGLNMARSATPLPSDALSDVSLPPEKTYDPLSANFYQPSFWFSLGTGAAFDCVGDVDPARCVTRTVFLEGRDTAEGSNPAVVLYLSSDAERRLVGVLLWNLTEDLFVDDEYAAPSRLHLARKMIAAGLSVHSDQEVLALAQKFDMAGEIAESYAELKALAGAQEAVEDKKELVVAAAEEEEKTSLSPSTTTTSMSEKPTKTGVGPVKATL